MMGAKETLSPYKPSQVFHANTKLVRKSPTIVMNMSVKVLHASLATFESYTIASYCFPLHSIV